MKDFFKAIEQMREPPCKVFHCKKRDVCSNTQSACTAFYLYVLTGRVHEPNMELTDGKPFYLREPFPTRAKFDEAMSLDV